MQCLLVRSTGGLGPSGPVRSVDENELRNKHNTAGPARRAYNQGSEVRT